MRCPICPGGLGFIESDHGARFTCTSCKGEGKVRTAEELAILDASLVPYRISKQLVAGTPTWSLSLRVNDDAWWTYRSTVDLKDAVHQGLRYLNGAHKDDGFTAGTVSAQKV